MALEARSIYFRYDRKKPLVLEDISLKVEKGERVAVTAPSGFGKTTLALLLSGYIKPGAGEILIDGKPLPEKGVCPVQLIYQHPEKAINPRRKLSHMLSECGGASPKLLEALGIEKEWLSRYPNELSGGELSRFCVARALSVGADYLICDEITTMLDAIGQAQIWSVILKEAQERNMGIIAITHNKHLAEKVATKIISLE